MTGSDRTTKQTEGTTRDITRLATDASRLSERLLRVTRLPTVRHLGIRYAPRGVLRKALSRAAFDSSDRAEGENPSLGFPSAREQSYAISAQKSLRFGQSISERTAFRYVRTTSGGPWVGFSRSVKAGTGVRAAMTTLRPSVQEYSARRRSLRASPNVSLVEARDNITPGDAAAYRQGKGGLVGYQKGGIGRQRVAALAPAIRIAGSSQAAGLKAAGKPVSVQYPLPNAQRTALAGATQCGQFAPVPQAPSAGGYERQARAALSSSSSPSSSSSSLSSSSDAEVTRGELYIDGAALGTWVTEYLERQISRPRSGILGVDARASPSWAGLPISN